MVEFNESKIVFSFMPTLLHLANVKIGILFFNQIEETILEKAFDSTRNKFEINMLCKGARESLFSLMPQQCIVKFQTARDAFLLIPDHLREGVMKAVHGLRNAADFWHSQNLSQFQLSDIDCVYYWKSNGMLDGPKTTHTLVLNVDIDIVKRFHLACQYCIVEKILDLWSEMEASGKTENLKLKVDSMAKFWVSWIRDGCRVPWSQAAAEFLCSHLGYYSNSRFSAFFPLLRLEQRQKLFTFLNFNDVSDYMQCLSAVTKAEQDQILERRPLKLLYLYSIWPLQSLLVEIFQKTWSYLSADQFCCFLFSFSIIVNCKDFDYCEIFGKLWEKSPVSFRNSAKRDKFICDDIDLWLDKLKNRKAKLYKREKITLMG